MLVQCILSTNAASATCQAICTNTGEIMHAAWHDSRQEELAQCLGHLVEVQGVGSKKLGGSQMAACFSLQFDASGGRPAKALYEHSAASHLHGSLADQLHVEGRELALQLAMQVQVQLDVAKKLGMMEAWLAAVGPQRAQHKAASHVGTDQGAAASECKPGQQWQVLQSCPYHAQPKQPDGAPHLAFSSAQLEH
ncbi:hypothetical protein EWM64_g7635 [Hericium alpestre]|uniref:Uncharacterized protein n=1 Tax=Hericium alpestre TaxID=135208 RepID=A0A4Y9ZSB5_9AGAM|nr:hypothetical protein EWM64_g7635 [Hericium alpestre]